MASDKRKLIFVPEEPGVLLLLLIAVVFLVFVPKNGCALVETEVPAQTVSE